MGSHLSRAQCKRAAGAAGAAAVFTFFAASRSSHSWEGPSSLRWALTVGVSVAVGIVAALAAVTGDLVGLPSPVEIRRKRDLNEISAPRAAGFALAWAGIALLLTTLVVVALVAALSLVEWSGIQN